jgi:hypothetical protein
MARKSGSLPMIALAVAASQSNGQSVLIHIPPLVNTTNMQAFAIRGNGTTITGRMLVLGTSARDHGFRGSAPSGLQDLGLVPGFTDSSGTGISGNGQTVAGVGLNPPPMGNALSTGFRWTQGGGLQPLQSFSPGWWHQAWAVSADATTIVGFGVRSVRLRAARAAVARRAVRGYHSDGINRVGVVRQQRRFGHRR